MNVSLFIGFGISSGISGITKKPRMISEREAAGKAAWESIRLQELQAAESRPRTSIFYRSVEKGGRLTDSAAAAAGLSDMEKQSVAGILHDAWEAAAANFIENAVLDEKKSNIPEGKYVYNIKAPDPDALAWKEFKNSLDAAIGKEKRKILIKGFDSVDCFGSLGSLDLTIEFLPREGTYSYDYGSPKTGQSHGSGQAALTKFSDRFGDTFDFSAMKIVPYNNPTEDD